MLRSPIALVLTAAILALAGCGDGDDDETIAAPSDGTATEQAQEPTVNEELAQRVQDLTRLARQSQVGKPMKEQLRIANAQAELLTIASENPAAIEPLLTALEKPDHDLILDLHSFYIQLGKPGSEKAIGEALQRLEPSPDNNTIVFAYLGSGNSKLVQAAERWADDNGYEIGGNPGPVAGGWGSAGVYGPPGVPPSVPGP
jgi:hypothetical protein